MECRVRWLEFFLKEAVSRKEEGGRVGEGEKVRS